MATPAGLCRSVLGPRVGERCDCGVSSQCRGLRASVWGHPRTVVFCGVRAFGGCASERISGCRRSEEHTSELQSLMRISYAVFCLKKKKHHINNIININQQQ